MVVLGSVLSFSNPTLADTTAVTASYTTTRDTTITATPAFAAADAPPSPRAHRLATLDGLRGVLALAVVFYHGAIYHRFVGDGTWTQPPSQVYTLLGQSGVAMFFMVTGYLFWSRLIAEAGRPSWLRLYIGRVFRIGPLYLVAAGAMVMVAFAAAGGHLIVVPGQFAREVGVWLTLGLVQGGNVNGYPGGSLLLAGVTWTLRYEWMFYIALPFAALAARRTWSHLPFAVAGLVALLAWAKTAAGTLFSLELAFDALFLAGMVCASLHAKGVVARLPDAVASVLVLALLAGTFTQFPHAYMPGAVLLLGGAFYPVASGCTVFGLLVSRPARRLGDVSYGIYLLQGLALAAVFRTGLAPALDAAAPAYHWGLMLLCAVLLVALATALHAAVERPGIALGRRAAAAVERRLLRLGRERVWSQGRPQGKRMRADEAAAGSPEV